MIPFPTEKNKFICFFARLIVPLHSIMRYCMRNVTALLVCLCLFASCGEYTKVQKTTDFEYKYDVAKAFYAEGRYGPASMLFGEVLAALKGSVYGEESLYMLAMSSYNAKDFESAATYFRKYYQSYPKGKYVEESRYKCGCALYKLTPDPRLDQTNTHEALEEFTSFLEHYPYTRLKDQTQEMILLLQDKLIEKEYLSAKLYYDLGGYVANCTFGGSNYEACVVTAQNALKDYPYASSERREAFSIMILRSKYHLAKNSVDEKRVERFRDAIDEYYAFANDFPESKYMKEAESMFKHSENIVKRRHLNLDEDE